MKKILIITGIFPPEIGGPASYADALAKELSLDHKVSVVTYSGKWSVKTGKEKPFEVVRIWKKWPWLIRHFLYAWKVFFKARSYDIILALNAINAGPSALVASKFFRKKYIVRIAGDRAWEAAMEKGKTSLLINDFQKQRRKGWARVIHWFQVWTCNKAEIIIVPSEFLAGIVLGWGVATDKIRIIYNSVDIEASALTKEEARKKLGISGNILISIGRLVPWKGFRMLIKIMPKLQDINQFFKLVIVGDGPDRENLKAMVRNLGLERKVHFTGRRSRDELRDFLAAADIFILNSGYEGFSHQILEAMACGVPVITSNAGGNSEVIRQGENGFMVKYNDEFNLIEAIKTLWQLPELREHFVAMGRETVAHFSFQKMVDETMALLKHSHG